MNNENKKSYPDGSFAKFTDDGQWDLTLPSGRHVSGRAETKADAEVAVTDAHNNFVLEQWEKGTFYPRNRFLVSLA